MAIKKRNADDRLRRLERVAFQTHASADRVAYWRACIQANVLPKPNVADAYGTVQFHTDFWILGNYWLELHYAAPKNYFLAKNNLAPLGPHLFKTKKAAEEYIKGWISGILEIYQEETRENPRRRRRNSDEDIRELERLAATDPEAREKLRWYFEKTGRGFVPPETANVIDRHGGFTAFITSKRQPWGNPLWRPGRILKGVTEGRLVRYTKGRFYQTTRPVTWACYKVKGYRYLVVLYFDEKTGARVA